MANEIAIIGASAVDLKIGGDFDPNGELFGSDADAGLLVREVRLNSGRSGWWSESFAAVEDELDKATWVLAFVTCAASQVLLDHLDELAALLHGIPAHLLDKLLYSSFRIGAFGSAREIEGRVAAQIAQDVPLIASLLAHHVPRDDRQLVANGLASDVVLELMRHPSLARVLLVPLAQRSDIMRDTDSLVRLISASGPGLQLGPETVPLAREVAIKVFEAENRVPWATLVSSDRALDSDSASQTLQMVADMQEWFIEPDGP